MQWSHTDTKTSRTFQYACACGTLLMMVASFAGMIPAGFLPPMSPSWTAERTVSHYRDHNKSIMALAAIFVCCTPLNLAFSVAIACQMRRIPNSHYAVNTLQLLSGCLCAVIFFFSGLLLAVASYRLDRNVEITQALNDFTWIIFGTGPIPFATQYFCFGYSIMADSRDKPLIPKLMGISNLVFSVFLVLPPMFSHTVKTGPLASNGVLGFWVPSLIWGVQTILDVIFLVRAISLPEQLDSGEEDAPITSHS